MSQIIKAQSPVYGGYVIARDNRVIFIKGAVPDEVVEVSISERKRLLHRRYKVIEPSPYRINPPCSVFGTCGGCHFQFTILRKAGLHEEEILLDSVSRIGKLGAPLSPAHG